MPNFLLPCECTAQVVVTAGQAGGTTSCQRCGRGLAVPKLRELEGLPRQEPEAPSRKKLWRPAHALALLGAIVALASLVASSLIRPEVAAIDERLLRAAVMSVDDLAIYKIWTEEVSRSGPRRPPSDEELRVLRQASFASGVRRALNIVTAGAALVATVAGIAVILSSSVTVPPAAGSQASAGGLPPGAVNK